MAKIDIYRAWCKACGICVAFCPMGVLSKDELGYPYDQKPNECKNCKWCELRCPDFAITVIEDDPKDHETKEQGKRDTLTGE